MTPLQILRDARELISVESRWTQFYGARDKYEVPIGVLEDAASCWCAVGALIRAASASAAHRSSLDIAMTALEAAAAPKSISQFNDSATHAQAVGLYDKAIAALEAEAGQ